MKILEDFCLYTLAYLDFVYILVCILSVSVYRHSFQRRQSRNWWCNSPCGCCPDWPRADNKCQTLRWTQSKYLKSAKNHTYSDHVVTELVRYSGHGRVIWKQCNEIISGNWTSGSKIWQPLKRPTLTVSKTGILLQQKVHWKVWAKN
jgi:hypothetical protein